jgi:hypothetical protein
MMAKRTARVVATVAVGALLGAIPVNASTPGPNPPISSSARVRTTDPVMAAALRAGILRSPTILRLVAAIDASDVIVYLAIGKCPRPAVACLMMGPVAAGTRYVRINFPLPEGPGIARAWFPDELSASIAHELQHAVEIIGWPEVVDGTTLQAAHLRRGLVGRHLDTDAAVQVGDTAHAELRAWRH